MEILCAFYIADTEAGRNTSAHSHRAVTQVAGTACCAACASKMIDEISHSRHSTGFYWFIHPSRLFRLRGAN